MKVYDEVCVSGFNFSLQMISGKTSVQHTNTHHKNKFYIQTQSIFTPQPTQITYFEMCQGQFKSMLSKIFRRYAN